jgi:hypothetical protein
LNATNNAQDGGKLFDGLQSIKPNERTYEKIKATLSIDKTITFFVLLVLVAVFVLHKTLKIAQFGAVLFTVDYLNGVVVASKTTAP